MAGHNIRTCYSLRLAKDFYLEHEAHPTTLTPRLGRIQLAEVAQHLSYHRRSAEEDLHLKTATSAAILAVRLKV